MIFHRCWRVFIAQRLDVDDNVCSKLERAATDFPTSFWAVLRRFFGMKQAFLHVALVCAACKGQNASKRPCLREVLVRLATPPVGRSRNDVFSAFFQLLFWFLVHFAHMGVLFQFLLAYFWLVGGVLHLNCPHCQYFALIRYICCVIKRF